MKRRTLLKTFLATGFVTAITNKSTFFASAELPIDVPQPQTPEEALQILLEGNKRFTEGHIKAPHRNIERLKEIEGKQTPFAAVLGCADSRVPVELLFDQGFGDIFVTRVAGNVATAEEIASLEFGTKVLGAKVLFVLGHSSCGAVSATIKGDAVPGQISTLFRLIQPAVKKAKGDLPQAIIENVKNQVSLLSESSPVIAELVREKKLIVAGGIFDLHSGKVTRIIDID